jgi:5-methylcytosine-specific restriction endonuclease McrA
MTTKPGRTDNTAWRIARALAIRDAGGQCQLCAGALDPTAVKNTPNATEVDHIHPLIYGGDPYDRDNLRAVHRWCHQRRDQGQQGAQQAARRPIPAVPPVWVPPDPWVPCPTCPSPCGYTGRPASRCW